MPGMRTPMSNVQACSNATNQVHATMQMHLKI